MHEQVALADNLAKLVIVAEGTVAEDVGLGDPETIREYDGANRGDTDRINNRKVGECEQ